MKTVRLPLTTAVLLCAMLVAAEGKPAGSPSHVLLDAGQVKWGPAPPVFNKGAQFAVLSGDPGKDGPYVVRLKMPAGYKVAPHWHPTDEQITVISGTFSLGMGDTFDPKATKALTPGGYGLMPAEMHHFAWTKNGATVQVHGMGPFAIHYVNPADDPSKAAGKGK
ncbi:MAG TPA: cupin domain-containing protein [Thermoanaerobaculia bacterium]|jgi:quercetin dioxygenase-like cupin family protein